MDYLTRRTVRHGLELQKTTRHECVAERGDPAITPARNEQGPSQHLHAVVDDAGLQCRGGRHFDGAESAAF